VIGKRHGVGRPLDNVEMNGSAKASPKERKPDGVAVAINNGGWGLEALPPKREQSIHLQRQSKKLADAQ
jgi:hypothetical protein